MSDWVEVFNYYDGYLEGLLFKDGVYYHWVITEDSPSQPGANDERERVYELRRIGHEPTGEELTSLLRDEGPMLRSLEIAGAIAESELHAFPLKEEL